MFERVRKDKISIVFHKMSSFNFGDLLTIIITRIKGFHNQPCTLKLQG